MGNPLQAGARASPSRDGTADFKGKARTAITASYFLQVALRDALGLPVLLTKVAVEFVLFFANFLVLRDWVFNKRPASE